MTYDQIHECIKNGNKMTTNQIYQDLEQLDVSSHIHIET